jgi:4-methyl-5(b-hydroxyethyl)-thiazole monophosphate biosynthesis
MVYVLLGKGFEETEAIAPVDLLRRADIPVLTVGIDEKVIEGSHKISVVADITLGEMDLTQMDMLVLPGGLGGVASVRANQSALDALRFAWENDKYVAAICAGPTVLADLGITNGKHAVCYPGCEENMGSAIVEIKPCLQDGKLITGASAGCATQFGLSLIRALRGEDDAKTVADQIVIRA